MIPTATGRRFATGEPESGRMEVYRKGQLRRTRRQAVTIPRAVRAGRARVRASPADPTVDGEALRTLIAEAAAEVRLVEVPANRRPWITTGMRAASGELVTWLAWGQAYLQ